MSVYGVEQMFPNGGWLSKQDECKCMLEYFSHALHADLFHGTVRQVHYTSSTLYVRYLLLMIAEYSSDWSVTSSLARTGQKVGKFVEGWTRDTQHSEGRTLGGHWTLCPAGTPNGERCQPETLDTVFQGSQKAAKEALVFSPSYMRVSHIVKDKSINEVREIFAGNRMLELFLSGAIIRGRKIGEMGWVVK